MHRHLEITACNLMELEVKIAYLSISGHQIMLFSILQVHISNT